MRVKARQGSRVPASWKRDAGNWAALTVLAILLHVAISSTSRAATITESFDSSPANREWRIFGVSNLFSWNLTNQNLAVTWDSSKSNSYFFKQLGTILTRSDNFSISLDLKLTDVQAGVDASKPSTFELGFGFLNLDDATKPTFARANGNSPNLVEFDYFPDTGFGGTVWPSFWSTNHSLNYNGSSDYTIMDLPIGVTMHITSSYSASNATVATAILTNGTPMGSVHSVKLSNTFTDFRVGTFAIESYSDTGQDPVYGGSLLAHGIVDNIIVMVPDSPVQNLGLAASNNVWRANFFGASNWVFVLERATNLSEWAPVSANVIGSGSQIVLTDTNAPGSRGYYRVRAQRP